MDEINVNFNRKSDKKEIWGLKKFMHYFPLKGQCIGVEIHSLMWQIDAGKELWYQLHSVTYTTDLQIRSDSRHKLGHA